MGRRAIQVVALLAAVGIAATGCSQATNGASGNGGATTTPDVSTAWDPCTLPDNLLIKAGLDPATKDTDNASTGKGCDWKSRLDGADRDVDVTVLSAVDRSLDFFRRQSINHDFQDLTLGGRPAVMYHQGVDTQSATLGFQLKVGVVGMIINKRGGPNTESADVWAKRIGNVLATGLPQ